MRAAASPPTARAIDVVEYLAHCDEPPSFSSVVRELDLSQATAHAILRTLTDRGWVDRNPADKTYSLGPVLAEVAACAATARPLADSARIAASGLLRRRTGPRDLGDRTHRRLAGDHRLQRHGGSLGHSERSDSVHAALRRRVRRVGVRQPTGRRGSDAARALDDALRRRLDDALIRTKSARIRRRLDHARAVADGSDGQQARTRWGAVDRVGAMIDRLLVECVTNGVLLEHDSRPDPQPVATIAAPVFDSAGHVALLVGVHPLGEVRLAEVEAIGRRLIDVTTALG